MTIEYVVAMSENRVIGRKNDLPWRLPKDLKHFKATTLGHAILMGRKTYESIGRPLPDRTNIILTSDPAYIAPGCLVVTSLEEALEMAQAFERFMVVGGAKVYEQFLPYVDIIHMTVVHQTLEGDAYFPELDPKEWDEKELENHTQDDKHEYAFSFKYLHRRTESNVSSTRSSSCY